jgi:hypothetical protein
MLIAGARRRLNHRYWIRGGKGLLKAALERFVELLILLPTMVALLAAAMLAVTIHVGALAAIVAATLAAKTDSLGLRFDVHGGPPMALPLRHGSAALE